jgi:hypothetical protein
MMIGLLHGTNPGPEPLALFYHVIFLQALTLPGRNEGAGSKKGANQVDGFMNLYNALWKREILPIIDERISLHYIKGNRIKFAN